MDENQVTMWVARDKNEDLYLHRNKPYKHSLLGEWRDVDDCGVLLIDPGLFPSVKWEDVEPTEVVLMLKN